MPVGDAVDWLGTYSGVITAPDAERAAGLAAARDVLLRRADGNGMVDIPMRTACWRADRVPRPASG
jgi:hypothetical protein